MSKTRLARAAPLSKATATAKHPPGRVRVGGTNDRIEREADRVANKIAGVAPPIVHEVLNSPGQPLDQATRDFFEPRFQHDFGNVRVHSDERAAESANAMDAQAYTAGQDVVFGDGRYNSTSSSGKQLLAHELTHVVQQSNPAGSKAHAAETEAEASSAGRRMESGHHSLTVKHAAARSIQKQPLTPDAPRADLGASASPLMAQAIGSVTLDGFQTGKSDISGGNQAKLSKTVETMWTLLKQYPASKIHVIGYTDAVGQESDNQALGQSRADAVQAALVGLGLPAVGIIAESRGANDLLVKTKKAEGRNRRVEVRFETSTLLRGGLTGDLSSKPAPAFDMHKSLEKGAADFCTQHPTLCLGKPGIPPPGPSPDLLKPIPSDVPYKLMDVKGVNDAYLSHNQNPSQAGDLTSTWARVYLKYRNLGLSKETAAKLANTELSSIAGQDQTRDNPNAIDQSNAEMKQQFPNSTTIGPVNLPWKWRF